MAEPLPFAARLVACSLANDTATAYDALVALRGQDVAPVIGALAEVAAHFVRMAASASGTTPERLVHSLTERDNP